MALYLLSVSYFYSSLHFLTFFGLIKCFTLFHFPSIKLQFKPIFSIFDYSLKHAFLLITVQCKLLLLLVGQYQWKVRTFKRHLFPSHHLLLWPWASVHMQLKQLRGCSSFVQLLPVYISLSSALYSLLHVHIPVWDPFPEDLPLILISVQAYWCQILWICLNTPLFHLTIWRMFFADIESRFVVFFV